MTLKNSKFKAGYGRDGRELWSSRLYLSDLWHIVDVLSEGDYSITITAGGRETNEVNDLREASRKERKSIVISAKQSDAKAHEDGFIVNFKYKSVTGPSTDPLALKKIVAVTEATQLRRARWPILSGYVYASAGILLCGLVTLVFTIVQQMSIGIPFILVSAGALALNWALVMSSFKAILIKPLDRNEVSLLSARHKATWVSGVISFLLGAAVSYFLTR